MRQHRSRFRISAAGSLPALLFGGLALSGPFGQTTAAVAKKHPIVASAPASAGVQIEPAATQIIVAVYLGATALAAVIILFALVWLRGADRRQDRRLARATASQVRTDSPSITARTGRSPVPAPRASRRRIWPAASAQRV